MLSPKPRPPSKTRRSRRFKREQLTSKDKSLSDSPTFPVLNASRVSLTDFETLLFCKGLYFCPTPHEVDDRKVREDTRAFFRMLRLNEQCLRKDLSKDQADNPPPLTFPITSNINCIDMGTGNKQMWSNWFLHWCLWVRHWKAPYQQKVIPNNLTEKKRKDVPDKTLPNKTNLLQLTGKKLHLNFLFFQTSECLLSGS